MTTHKGFGLIAALVIIAGLFAIGGGAYVALTPKEPAKVEVSEPGDEYEQQADTARKEKGWIELDSMNSISWKLTPSGERENIPYTKVAVSVGTTTHEVGEFQGSCTEVSASGGVDGKGLLAGELSAVQCWFAGGGDEIGVFAHEDGGYQIMVGSISEPDGEGSTGFRGDFSVKADIRI